MASLVKRWRLVSAQLDGAERRLAALVEVGDHVDDQMRRVAALRAELAALNEAGAASEQGRGGLWGPDGPNQPHGRLYSSSDP